MNSLYNYRLTLDEIAAAAEMILAQEEEEEEEVGSVSSDECEGEGSEEDGDLGDSGYGGGTSPMDTRYVLILVLYSDDPCVVFVYSPLRRCKGFAHKKTFAI